MALHVNLTSNFIKGIIIQNVWTTDYVLKLVTLLDFLLKLKYISEMNLSGEFVQTKETTSGLPL